MRYATERLAQIKAQQEGPLNPRQLHAMQMLREDARRDIYEGAHPKDSKRGSGEFFLSYANGHGPTLTASDVDDLARRGLICLKYADCPGWYRLKVRP